MKLVFFGTSEFATPILEALTKEYEVSVVTTPDSPSGRGNILTPAPMGVFARKLGLSVLRPENLSNVVSLPEAEIAVVAAYGKLIPQKVIEQFDLGIINVHPSLLPKYRGPSPVQFAILNGESDTGVSIIKIDSKMDHGDLLGQARTDIGPNEKYAQLNSRLWDLGADLLMKSLSKYISGNLEPVPQEHDKATLCELLSKDSGKIDWNNAAQDIYNMFRAFHEWPGIWTELGTKKIQITDCLVADIPCNGSLGSWHINEKKIYVTTAKGCLEVLRLKMEGKSNVSSVDFINGYSDMFE